MRCRQFIFYSAVVLSLAACNVGRQPIAPDNSSPVPATPTIDDASSQQVTRPTTATAPSSTVVPSVTPDLSVSPVASVPSPSLPTATSTLRTNLVIPPPDVPFVLHDGFYGDSRSLYIREEPHTLSTVAFTVTRLTPLDIIGRTADNTWLNIQLEDGRGGWVLARHVRDTVDTTLPVNGQAVNVNDVFLLPDTLETALNLYSARGGGDIVQELPPLTPLRVEMHTLNDQWLYVTLRDDTQGWIRNPGFDIDLASVPLYADTTATASTAVAVAVTPTAVPDAIINDDGDGLRLRQLPSLDGTIMLNMPAGQPLMIYGRTADGWLLVELPEESYRGWAYGDYVTLNLSAEAIELINDPQPVAIPEELRIPPTSAAVASGGGTNAREIYLRGQARGNRRYVFTTVGDSLSDTPYFLRHIIYDYNLRNYGYLQPTLDFFNADTGYGNAFARRSFSANAGWSTFSALEPANADPNVCQPGETPIACEYRVTKPAVALIMIGTNDLPAFPAETYRANMIRILDISAEYGVVPVLSTLPPRPNFNARVQEYNQVIRQLAAAYSVPLWDFHQAAAALPDNGISPDAVHLSIPPNAPQSTMDFTEENLRYGTTMRNLTALQMLDTIRKQLLN